MGYKLGRLPAQRPAALADLQTYATGKLPTPPRSINPPTTSYPIDGNDRYGDCVMAGVAHLISAWDTEVKEPNAIPTEQTIVEEYFKLTGGEDTGLSESETLRTWHREGLFGEKIAGYAPVSTTNLLEWHQAVAFFGGMMLGIECPQSAQEQFEAGEPWTYVEGSPVLGGHCVIALGYGPNGGLHVATWGSIAVLEAAFLAHYLDEAWVVLPPQFVEAKHGRLGIDLQTLTEDLAKV